MKGFDGVNITGFSGACADDVLQILCGLCAPLQVHPFSVTSANTNALPLERVFILFSLHRANSVQSMQVLLQSNFLGLRMRFGLPQERRWPHSLSAPQTTSAPPSSRTQLQTSTRSQRPDSASLREARDNLPPPPQARLQAP